MYNSLPHGFVLPGWLCTKNTWSQGNPKLVHSFPKTMLKVASVFYLGNLQRSLKYMQFLLYMVLQMWKWANLWSPAHVTEEGPSSLGNVLQRESKDPY